jgi:long-chain acyl-CoA synthetase
MLMIGYLDNEEETQKVLRDGHYYTGDLGRFEDGNLFIAGRKKDVIKVAGVVVHAAEVEEALRNHPAVKDVAVTPVENKRLGEVIKATVVLVDDGVAEKLTSNKTDERQDAQRQLEREFRAFCKQHLSRYKRPMKWDFPDPHEGLPKTLAGKVDKKAVKAQSKFSFAKFKGIIKRAVSHS